MAGLRAYLQPELINFIQFRHVRRQHEKKLVSTLSLAVMASFPMGGAVAQEMPEALLQATRQAVAANPDVQARWHVFTGAEADQDFARAAYRPPRSI